MDDDDDGDDDEERKRRLQHRSRALQSPLLFGLSNPPCSDLVLNGKHNLHGMVTGIVVWG